jgi:PmbA protein
MNSYNNLMREALDHLKGRCQEAELLLDFGKTLSMSSEKKELSKYSVSSTSIMGVRLIKEGRLGMSYSEALDKESIQQMIEDALSNSRFAESKDDERIVNDGGHYEEDEQYSVTREENPPLAKMMEDVIQLESAVLGKSQEVQAVPYNGIYQVEGGRMIMNHLGSQLERRFKYFGGYTSAVILHNGMSSEQLYGVTSRNYTGLNLNLCVEESYREARNLLDAQTIPTGDYDVIFNIETWHQLFSSFSMLFSAQAAMDGHNPFRHKIGEKAFSEMLTVSDHPLYTTGMAYSTFDAEGTKRKELKLIEKGVFTSFYHNHKTAHHFLTQTTGHASRSAKSSLDLSSTHTFIAAGKSSEKELMSGKLFFITKLQGLHSGVHPVSGEFSLAAKGYLMKDGERQQAVKGVTISGNFYKMLSHISLMGDKVEEDDLIFFSPLIRFASLKVAGP